MEAIVPCAAVDHRIVVVVVVVVHPYHSSTVVVHDRYCGVALDDDVVVADVVAASSCDIDGLVVVVVDGIGLGAVVVDVDDGAVGADYTDCVDPRNAENNCPRPVLIVVPLAHS